VSPSVLLADWTDSSRMRDTMPCISPIAPSATCDIEMPSFALRCACEMERICDFSDSLMPRPAASSPALLMRIPDDSLLIEDASASWVPVRLR
jgi:hypothetical protein